MKPKLVYIPEADLTELERLVKKGHYGNINEAIRQAIKDLIRNHRKWEMKQ